MEQPERSLTSLGRHVAGMQDRAPEAQLDRERGRARLLRADTRRPRRPLPRALLLAAALLSVVGAALSVVLVGRAPAPLRFDVGAAQAGAVGEWIAAPAGTALPIRFSDGSELLLAPGGRARVASVSADGAEIALERGSLDLSVVHREETRWRVRVGPFQVNVVGTRFEASWDPVTERFTVALREGAITVSGPVVGEARPMRAGERLVVSPATGTLETGPIDTTVTLAPGGLAPGIPPEATPAPGAPPSSVPVEDRPAPGLPASGGPGPEAGSSSSSPAGRAGGASQNTNRAATTARPPGAQEASVWRSLAREGKHKDALAAAEREGFEGICTSASAAELHALGEAARLGGDTARAARAFTALRSRFAGSAEAASAAFLLGRSAQDRQKDHAAAAAWFTRYLSEQPSGAFAAEAAGRLVEARDRAGDEAGARRAAERYLATYPGGSHAAYARTVLARGADAGAPGDAGTDAEAAAPVNASVPAGAGAPLDSGAP